MILPFSNMQKQGFENKLAEMVADELQRPIEFAWWPPRARFKEKWLKANRCDLVMGTTASSDDLLTTRPYYRSSYVFVSRRDRNISSRFAEGCIAQELSHRSPHHRRRRRDRTAGAGDGATRIGEQHRRLQPLRRPAFAKSVRRASSPPWPMETWTWRWLGAHWPAYFARSSAVPLQVTPICQPPQASAIPVAFSISMGVAARDTRRCAISSTILSCRHQQKNSGASAQLRSAAR